MPVPGPKPKPHLSAVREGTYRSDRHSEGVKFAPVPLTEPDWDHVFPDGVDTELLRRIAAEAWQRTAPALSASVGLTDHMRDLLTQFCVVLAQISQAERAIAVQGPVGTGERGTPVRSPWSQVLRDLRTVYLRLAGELGLTPSAATRLAAPEQPDTDDGIWD
ncbi:phage terminase small subunit P27 family [Streptomyces smyrnaeus]|uniref:phage terminase small subunit P27 family n=1 Tax=Streptomyces smyrnaeus TaxID=1387713 RepID=UPI0033E9FBA4